MGKIWSSSVHGNIGYSPNISYNGLWKYGKMSTSSPKKRLGRVYIRLKKFYLPIIAPYGFWDKNYRNRFDQFNTGHFIFSLFSILLKFYVMQEIGMIHQNSFQFHSTTKWPYNFGIQFNLNLNGICMSHASHHVAISFQWRIR